MYPVCARFPRQAAVVRSCGPLRTRPRGVNDRTTPKLLRDTATPERDDLCPMYRHGSLSACAPSRRYSPVGFTCDVHLGYAPRPVLGRVAASWACDLGGWDRRSYGGPGHRFRRLFPLRQSGPRPSSIQRSISRPGCRAAARGAGLRAARSPWPGRPACPLQRSHVRLGGHVQSRAPEQSRVDRRSSRAGLVPLRRRGACRTARGVAPQPRRNRLLNRAILTPAKSAIRPTTPGTAVTLRRDRCYGRRARFA